MLNLIILLEHIDTPCIFRPSMREDPELCARGMDDAAANLNERVGLGWCAGVLVMVVYLRNGIYSKEGSPSVEVLLLGNFNAA